MKEQIRNFETMEEKFFSTWQTVNLKIKNTSDLSKSSTITSMLQIAMYLSYDELRTLFAQYTQPKYHDLSTNNTRWYWSWIVL